MATCGRKAFNYHRAVLASAAIRVNLIQIHQASKLARLVTGLMVGMAEALAQAGLGLACRDFSLLN